MISSFGVGVNKFLKLIIILYQKFFSQIFGKSCRFFPTCSEYTFRAIEKYGAFKGCFLGIKRVLRCHPFSRGGYDPIP